MGFRFRRSVKIIPGVRLNFSTRGISTSIGPRGANIHFGATGTYANLGLPGTGLSYRARLDGGASRSRSGSRSAYRELIRQQRETERAVARAAAADEHAAHEAVLERLRTVVADRVREPYDWDATWARRGAFTPQAFVLPAPSFTDHSIRHEARRRRPMWPWLVSGAFVAMIGFGGQTTSMDILAAMSALVGAGGALWAWHTRKALRVALCREAEQAHAVAVAAAEAQHQMDEAERRAAWEHSEALAEQVRSAVERRDAAPLAEVLETELANEELPVPLVFEIEFDSIQDVAIELVLPGLETVPEERTQLTKTGKVAYRNMAQRDRTALYTSLCAGVALRLVHETFRVLPMIRRVELFGTAEGIDPATGQEREFVALHVVATREAFTRLNLDRVEPLAALEGLGGRLAHSRSGELQPVPGVEGLTSTPV